MAIYDEVVARAMAPVGCGYVGCPDVVFGIVPIVDIHGLAAVRQFETRVNAHGQRMGHRRRKLREVSYVDGAPNTALVVEMKV